MLELPGLNALLPHIAPEIQTIKEREEEREKETAYRFDPFSYLRTSELGICRIIADLLRPNGEHGQGALFLKQFLLMLGILTGGSERARVVTEMLTTETDQSRRRIDIYIELDDGRIVAIEAKPFARESEDQVENMIVHAEKRASHLGGVPAGALYTVFLTPGHRS